MLSFESVLGVLRNGGGAPAEYWLEDTWSKEGKSDKGASDCSSEAECVIGLSYSHLPHRWRHVVGVASFLRLDTTPKGEAECVTAVG